MARWKVTAKHYLYAEQYGQPTEWERQETNVDTGRMFRKNYKVPMFIDPDDKFCVNPHEGFCVVARKGSDKPGDIVFFGPPTPDMEPLDDEAKAETQAEQHKWVNPIEGLEPTIGEDFGKKLLEMLERQLDAASRTQTGVSLKGASSSEVDELKKIVAQQQEAINKFLGAAQPKPVEEEQVVDTEPPLPEIDPAAIPKPPPVRGPMRRV